MKQHRKYDVTPVVRIPAILGVNGEHEVLKEAFRFLRDQVPNNSLELLPYHKFGEKEYRELGRGSPAPSFGVSSHGQMHRWQAMAESYGIPVVSFAKSLTH